MILLILTHVGAFIAGALVFRNNKDKAEVLVQDVKDSVVSIKTTGEEISGKL